MAHKISRLACIEFLACQHGRTLENLTAAFEVSVKTVQRYLKSIREDCPNILREEMRANRKVFWIEQPRGLKGVALKPNDLMTLHVMNKAISALEALGCNDDAFALSDFARHLRRNFPHASLKRVDGLLSRLADCDSLNISQKYNVAGKTSIKRRMELAIITNRDARFVLASGATVIGNPLRIQDGQYGANLLVSTSHGERQIAISDIAKIDGLDDVISQQYA